MRNMREDRTNFVYLGKYTEYTKEDIVAVIDGLFAKVDYLTNPKLVFESTMEPYEDYPGDAVVYVKGMRPATEEEIKADREYAEAVRISEEMGVTFYEAKTIQDLKKRGKI